MTVRFHSERIVHRHRLGDGCPICEPTNGTFVTAHVLARHLHAQTMSHHHRALWQGADDQLKRCGCLKRAKDILFEILAEQGVEGF